MKIKDLFEKWGLTGLKVKLPILEMDWAPSDVDKDAAWDLYIELLTRITTQPLAEDHGIEKSALDSVHNIFPLTRQTLKHHGRKAEGFTKISIIVLNQVIRPFTAKWHKLSQNNGFDDADKCKTFRKELAALQTSLREYTKLLADIADVEDLTEIEG